VTDARAVILGCGAAAPEGRLTNADLEARGLDTSDSWIADRTGIRERRLAGPDDTTASLAAAAGASAIKNSGLTPDDIGLVVLATTTPDQCLPATSASVQDMLGVRCGALDLSAACAGFVYALGTVASLVEAGRADNVLIIGAEVLSRIVDPQDRNTSILFGDGAGAAVVGRVHGTAAGLLSWNAGCDGSVAAILEVPAGEQFMQMDGPEVFRRAVRVLVESGSAALDEAGVHADDISLLVPHQANVRIISAAADRLGIAMDRVMVNLDRYGNTSAASIPLALNEAVGAGRVRGGDLVLLSGFGAGMTWASAVVRWGSR
jgi:3-oxoacyl-[acyl-carrier-protein] synthase-3